MDTQMLLQEAEEFKRLSEEIQQKTGMNKESAERAVIFAGHRQIEQALDDLLALFSEYIQVRGENALQLQGLINRVLKFRNK